jgi:hypothetical protein
VRSIHTINDMDAAGVELADLDGLSVAELKTLLQEQYAQLLTHREQLVVKDAQILCYTVEIETLKLQILKLRVCYSSTERILL